MCPVVLTGDIKQAFLQIRIREEDRDALHFHWLKRINSDDIEILRFTRAIFGLGESSFLLNAIIKEHLTASKEMYPELTPCIEEIEESLYVDDLVTGDTTHEEVKKIKETAIKVFGDAKFELHKWHSNVTDLNDDTFAGEVTYAKQELGTEASDCKILGVHWNKSKDTFGVKFDLPRQELNKRAMLKVLASIFDPLGLVSPITLLGKDMYRRACDLKLPWDQQLPDPLAKSWTKWLESLPRLFEVSRSIPTNMGLLHSVTLHVFADASAKGVSAALYAIIHQSEGKSQGLLASKSRISKKNLTIPRLELVAAQMAAKLLSNARTALKKYSISECYGWSDSTTVLFWL